MARTTSTSSTEFCDINTEGVENGDGEDEEHPQFTVGSV